MLANLHFMEIVLIGGYALIGLLVSYRVLINARAFASILSSTPNGTIDPERLQLLIVTLIAVGGYVLSVISAAPVSEGLPKTEGLLKVPDSLMVLLGGSQILYLSGKITRQNLG